MALDEANRRLSIVSRRPAVLLVFDTGAGAVVAKLPAVSGCDDVFHDRKRKQIYATSGEGKIVVYQQLDANHYRETARIETIASARASLFVPELDRLFVAARQQGNTTAALRVYKPTN